MELQMKGRALHVLFGGVVGEADGVSGLLESDLEALDLLACVCFGVDHLLGQDELRGLDAVEDGDEDLARLHDVGELVEAEVGVEVARGENGHGDPALPDALVDALMEPVAGAHGLVVQEGADPPPAEVAEAVVQEARHVMLGVHPAVVDEHVVLLLGRRRRWPLVVVVDARPRPQPRRRPLRGVLGVPHRRLRRRVQPRRDGAAVVADHGGRRPLLCG